MNPTREELCAYIDGELGPSEMAKIATAVESSPELKQYVLNQERLLENLRSAFAPLMNEAVPERLFLAAINAPVSMRSRVREWLGQRVSHHSGSVLRFAVPTAALAVGLFVGIGLERPDSADFIASPGSGQIIARADLARALNHELASQPSAATTRIGMTFRSKSGDICRTFEVAGAVSTTDGIACHQGDEWQVGALVNGTKQSQTAGYELAGSSTPQAIRDAVTSDMVGLPFDAKAERTARDNGWK